MGFFDIFKNKAQKAVDAYQPTESAPAKPEPQKLAIDMSKHEENLNRVLIDMSKNKKIDLTKHTARVGMALDYSGSMSSLYDNGSVQDVINRLLPIAIKFDDNGELESWIFSNKFLRLESVNINNYKDYVDDVILSSPLNMAGTYYAPVLNDIDKYYRKVEPSNIPSFVIFITDGDNFDHSETNKVIRKLSEYNIFIQFIGIGYEDFDYLKQLDDLDGRLHDNTGFTSIVDMNKMTDQELYTELLRQYTDWVNGKQ